MKLTDAIAAGLEPPAGKTEHFEWDDTLPGFGLRVRKFGADVVRRWYIQYRVGRQQRRESLGDPRKIKIEAARTIARKRFAQVELGADPAADRAKAIAEAAAVRLTLGRVADRYLVARKDALRPTTYAAASRYFELHWQPLRSMPIGTIKRADIAARLQEITAERGKVSSARARTNLSALFNWAMGEGLCEVNPVNATNIPDADNKPRERVLDDPELRAIWQNCQNDDFGRIVKLLILCGNRRSEIGNLMWDEVDLDSGVLVIPGEKIKNGETLKLTLAPAAIEILRSAPRRDQQPYVFGKKGKAGFCAWSYCSLALNNRIAAATGKPLQPWALHDLRRTARTGLGRIGVPPHIAERVIGHAKPGIEKIYDRYDYTPEIAQALARWADHVAGIVEGRAGKVVPLRA